MPSASLPQPPTRRSSPFYASSLEEAEASAARLQEAGALAAHQVDVLVQAVDPFWTALPLAPHVPNHGDLSVENALWHEGQVVALLDLRVPVTKSGLTPPLDAPTKGHRPAAAFEARI